MTVRELIRALEALPCADDDQVVVDTGDEWHDVQGVRLPDDERDGPASGFMAVVQL